MMLHGRNLQERATAAVFDESDNSLLRDTLWFRSGQISAQASLTLREHKLSQVQVQLRVVPGEGLLNCSQEVKVCLETCSSNDDFGNL